MKYGVKRLTHLLFTLRNRIILKRKINKIIRKIDDLQMISRNLRNQHRKIWKDLNKNTSIKWYRVYASVNGNYDPNYISEIEYYNIVEPTLNHKTFSDAYTDKNNYHKVIDKAFLPYIYLRCIQGVYYSQSYRHYESFTDLFDNIPEGTDKLVVKIAFDSGGGQGVGLYMKSDGKWTDSNGEELNENPILKTFGSNFIVQEYIHQHPYFARFNSSSVNTVRLFTYRSVKNNEIIPIHALLRIGRKGSFVDNQAAGGISCGISSEGRLNKFAVDKWGNKYKNHNDVFFSEEDKVLKFSEIIQLGKDLASEFHYHRLLGFDFAVDREEKIALIEINNRNNEINFYQMNNGPLFDKYTGEIIEYCMENKKTVQFDFSI